MVMPRLAISRTTLLVPFLEFVVFEHMQIWMPIPILACGNHKPGTRSFGLRNAKHIEFAIMVLAGAGIRIRLQLDAKHLCVVQNIVIFLLFAA